MKYDNFAYESWRASEKGDGDRILEDQKNKRRISSGDVRLPPKSPDVEPPPEPVKGPSPPSSK